MKVEIHFSETWDRTLSVQLREEELVAFSGHDAPFTEEEVCEYLQDLVMDPDGWMKGMKPPGDTPGDEFSDIDVWYARGPGVIVPESMGGRPVLNVIDGL